MKIKGVVLPIKWKLALWYGSILGLVLIAFSVWVYVYYKTSLEQSIDRKLKSIADVLSSSIVDTSAPTIFGNFESYLENIFGRKPKGKVIQILDASGKIGAQMSDLETQTLPISYKSLEKALSGIATYETIGEKGSRLRIITLPIIENGKVVSIVQVGTSLEDYYESLSKLIVVMAISIPSALIFTLIGGYFLAKKSLRPVDQIRKAAIKISSSNLDEKIDVGGRRDELGKLAETFNEMIERLRDSFQRINQFSLDVSHELKTPLAIMKGETEVALRKERDKEEYQRILRSNLEEIDRMTKIIDDLLFLSKAETNNLPLVKEPVALHDLITDVCLDMKSYAEEKGVNLEIGYLEDVSILGDELKLRRMLVNIIDNGIKYTNPGGKVEVTSYVENGYARIDVKDTGIGISETDIKYIFDRFYRADKSRRRESGTGLGLSISKWIAEAHNGMIEVKSTPRLGSTFSVRLPIG
ncbi:MAG: ATP-binding protein [Desulfobacterota bacterium]|nr:ATP-binding protein [Thermodesulfobacteriota bacterium]MDW8002413.1 ATP-binding protein [Deltaproteobacteria bacterium]